MPSCDDQIARRQVRQGVIVDKNQLALRGYAPEFEPEADKLVDQYLRVLA